MEHECASYASLQRELQQLRESSERRARQDHDQCVAMFQQMEELVRLNEKLIHDCGRPGGCDTGTEYGSCFDSSKESGDMVETTESGHEQLRRLQAIIVEQEREIGVLRRRQREAAVDGRVRDNQREGNVKDEVDDHAKFDEDEDGDTDSAENDGKTLSDGRSAVRRHASQLRKLPLTSLHAQLKGKDLQLTRLQQIIARLESRFAQLSDRKRFMMQSFQHTARTQQAHLKKYLAYIRQQTSEKKALERQLRELKQYVDVLEKKVAGSSRKTSNRRGREMTSVVLRSIT